MSLLIQQRDNGPQKGRIRRVFVPHQLLAVDEVGVPEWLSRLRARDGTCPRWREVNGCTLASIARGLAAGDDEDVEGAGEQAAHDAGVVVDDLRDGRAGEDSIDAAPDDGVLEEAVWVVAGPTWFPQLRVDDPTEPAYGRPTLAESDPARVEFVARAIDICGFSRNEVGRALAPSRLADAPDAQRKQAYRDLGAARRLLHADGVLPWAAFGAGELPAKWWVAEPFARAIHLWRLQAVADPSRQPSLAATVEECARELRPIAHGALTRSLRNIRGLEPGAQLAQARVEKIEANPWRWDYGEDSHVSRRPSPASSARRTCS